MILEFLITIALDILDMLIGLLPTFDASSFESALSYFFEIMSGVCYLFPMGTVATILGITVGLYGVRLFVSLLKTLWDLIPML